MTDEQHDKLAFLLQSGALPTPPRVVGPRPPSCSASFGSIAGSSTRRSLTRSSLPGRREVWKELTGEPLDIDLKVLPFLPAAPGRGDPKRTAAAE